MAVRVKVRLEALKGPVAGTAVEAVALVNSGYEAEEDELTVPTALARLFGWWPVLPPDATLVTVQSYTGTGTAYVLAGALRVTVLEPDRPSVSVTCAATVAPAETEALLSDYLAGTLEILLINTRTGEWCFRGEASVRRQSHAAQLW